MVKKLLSLLSFLMICSFGMNSQLVNVINDIRLNNQRKHIPIVEKLNGSLNKFNIQSQLKLNDDELWWGYFNGEYEGSDPYEWLRTGYGGAITYGCCIKILPENEFNIGKGKTIEGIKIAFTDLKNIEDVAIWMSTSLPINKTASDANILLQSIDKRDLVQARNGDGIDYINEIRFDKPYTIGDEPVYVGYTFRVTKIDDIYDQTPVVLCSDEKCIIKQENGFYWKYDDDEKWDKEKEDVLAMQVLFSGEFVENSLSISSEFNDVITYTDSEDFIEIQLVNLGKNGVNNFKYILSTDNMDSDPILVTPDTSIEGIGSRFKYKFPLQTTSKEGLMGLKFKVVEVNGIENSSNNNISSGDLIALNDYPLRKVLLEDITGIWGSGTAFGFINLSKLKKIYSDQIVPISIHIGKDPMVCKDYKSYLDNAGINSIPGVNIDRTQMDIYPYYSFTGDEFVFDFPEFVDKARMEPTVATVNTHASLSSDKKKVLGGADITFAYSGDRGDYALCYVLTADGLSDNSWEQVNGLVQYQGIGLEEYDPLFDKWVNGESKMNGIIYDDVAIAAFGVESGIDNSIQIPFEKGEVQHHDLEILLDRYPLIQDPNKMHLCAFLINTKSGKVINADRVAVKDTTNNTKILKNVEILDVYTIDGIKIPEIQQGVNIVTYSDGSVRKIIIQ